MYGQTTVVYPTMYGQTTVVFTTMYGQTMVVLTYNVAKRRSFSRVYVFVVLSVPRLIMGAVLRSIFRQDNFLTIYERFGHLGGTRVCTFLPVKARHNNLILNL